MPIQAASTGRYGALQEGFSIVLGNGYQVLVGTNDSGKSSILQLAFVAATEDANYGLDKTVLLLPERTFGQVLSLL